MQNTEREYYACTLLIERRRCKGCGAVHEAPNGPFLNERTVHTRHSIRVDKITDSLRTLIGQVSQRIKYFDSTVEMCQSCFFPTETGNVYSIPMSEGLSEEQRLEEKRHGAKVFKMTPLSHF